MPILRKEGEIQPPELFSLDVALAPWVVVHVRSRQEKTLARFFDRHGLPYYLPQVEQKSTRAGRSFTSYLPLFPSYVFSRRADGWEVAWRSNVIAAVIEVPDQELLSIELGQLRALQEAGASLVPAQPCIVAGDAVRVTEGVFRDYRGTVVRESGATRLLVSVTILRKCIEVEFPRAVLAPAPSIANAPPAALR